MTVVEPDGDVLVLRVWREDGFRARLIFGDPEDAATHAVSLASETETLEAVRRWLVGEDP